MSLARKSVRAALPSPLRSRFVEWLGGVKRGLYPYRPRYRDRRFWAVQGLVALIAGVHISLEVLEVLETPVLVGAEPQVGLLSFVPVSLFFIPVIYAALNFGFAGSVATALWCSLLTVPNLVLHPGMERVRELVQLGLVDAVAVFVGGRVERERTARQLAEAAGAALRASEAKYRGLFEFTRLAILIVDPTGIILEANPAAGALFGQTSASLKGMTLTNMVQTGERGELLSTSRSPDGQGGYWVLKPGDGSEIYLEPTMTRISDSQGKPIIQVLLRDVTWEQQQQAGLRTYAAYVLRAQEEERKRIAQELHDETVQALVLLCRRLDILESASRPLPPSVISELREIRRSAEEVAGGLRDFARTLRPPILEDLGLATSIRRLLLDLGERAHLEARMKIVGQERRLSPDIELGVFRIAQEALRNVERHARATRVSVAMTYAEDKSVLEVVDNGVGFHLPQGPHEPAANGRLGLLGMRERAALLGAKLEIVSQPGHGTRVTVSLPLRSSDAVIS